jgi:hypothetical protein
VIRKFGVIFPIFKTRKFAIILFNIMAAKLHQLNEGHANVQQVTPES